MAAKLDDEVKQFEDEYKKCRVVKQGTVKEAEKFAKRVKYFRYDMLMCFEGLEEEAAVDKGGSDPINAKKINDYAQDKKFRDMLKGINWNYAKLSEACKVLDRMEKGADADANKKKLEVLYGKIAKDLKQRKKKTPSKTAIESLAKQIKDDLKVLNEFLGIFRKIPPKHRDAEKEYAKQEKIVLTAKPRVSATQKKFNAAYPKMLVKNVLRKTKKSCDDAVKEVKSEAVKLVDFATDGPQIKKLAESIEKGQKQLQIIEKLEADYSKIKNKCQKEINNAEDGDKIEDLIQHLVDSKKDAVTQWDKAVADMKKAGAKAGVKVKA